MTTQLGHARPFLNVASAEKATNLGELRDSLAEAARNAERLGLHKVKEHIEVALAHVVEQHESEDGT